MKRRLVLLTIGVLTFVISQILIAISDRVILSAIPGVNGCLSTFNDSESRRDGASVTKGIASSGGDGGDHNDGRGERTR